MSKLSKSPERHTFQKESYIKKKLEEGKEPDPSIIKMYEDWANEPEFENRPAHDLEYDLRTTDWILDKVRNSNTYAQNLYAAMCNIQWQSREFWQEMKGETWSCSWRSAGGIIADMQQKGDYIDWYCSGIGGLTSHDPEEGRKEGYVSEGVVTEEIELDLNRLGWRPVPWPDNE